MFQFAIRFLICNIFIAGTVGVLLLIKYLFRNHLSARIHYNLWFLLLGVMAIPFIPFHLPEIGQCFQLIDSLNSMTETGTRVLGKFNPSMSQINTTGWANEFTVSVSRNSPAILGYFFFSIWMVGMIAMVIMYFRSKTRRNKIKKAALPLQNQAVKQLFEECKRTLGITKNVSVFSTAFLKSPITIGVIHPQIYIPIHLISDYHEKEMRYILLHELQHYRYRDAIPNFFVTIAGILYWFNPAIWYALGEIRTEREIACDSAVLQTLNENDYESYGNTLLDFAQKISLSPFPFASGLGGNKAQLKRRIMNIVSYEPLTRGKRLRSVSIFVLATGLLTSLLPFFSTYAAEHEYYDFQTTHKEVTYMDLSTYFDGFHGSFVLYDTASNTWQIYNKELAAMRVSPDSTYKIYEGLMGLNQGVISPDFSTQSWDGTNQPFSAWNSDHTLNSAMQNSVNWYFDRIEQSIGLTNVQNYLNQIDYGNKNLSAKTDYWMESSLKISPIEQVELLIKLNRNQLSADEHNTASIKQSILLASDSVNTMYGKTGTGRINGQDINGWFIGYIEKSGQTYYFATNIQGNQNATGGNASDITQSILSDLQIGTP
ncbi:MAG: BlaR1 family beta-lactam sensor/signal transducer [Lachnospiraceae bacterium]|nr:BlaR1 family beta-lactam sensor/signal transducer [Lachnospiraceae bacterium]